MIVKYIILVCDCFWFSGNQIGDFGARMLSKALQINSKLRCILWDKNLISVQGFEDIAQALQKWDVHWKTEI